MSYAFIWDMDGTLVDSYPAIVPATQLACSESGLHFSTEEIHEAVIRTSVGTFLETVCSERGLDPAPVKARFSRLNDTHIDAIRAIPHAEEALRALTDAGHRCFVYTHRGASCLAILTQTGLLPYPASVFHRSGHCSGRISPKTGSGRYPVPDGEVSSLAHCLFLCRGPQS